MPMEQIEFVIKPDGTVEEKVLGVKGPNCRDLTKGIEAKVGEVLDSLETPEYFEQPVKQWGSVTTKT